MKANLVAAAGLLSLVQGFKLVPKQDYASSKPAVLHAPIQRKNVPNPILRDRIRRRQNTLQETLDNEQTLYFANASLGTPSQSLRLHLDTGSSDLWVNSVSSQLCRGRNSDCSISGTYDANSSTTYRYVNSLFNISYVDGSGASGDYATETFSFGGQKLDGMQFGIGYHSTSPEGILGIGYMANEAQVNRAGADLYPNLPQLLVNNGAIKSNAYSLWLNDLDANTGSILFGGIDTQKYHGSLSRLPIIQEAGDYREFIIALTGLKSNGTDFAGKSRIPVLLDSGSSLIYLPDSIVSTIYKKFNAQYDDSQGAAFVDCSLAQSTQTIDFTFSSPTISVPMNELVVVAGVSRRGAPVCILGIAPTGGSTPVLGDTFLRSAYVVYDLANNQIAIAPTNFNATGTNVQEISTGTNSIPDSTVVANAVSSITVATGGARNGGPSVTSKGAAAPTRTPAPVAKMIAAAGAGLLLAL